jgi:iron(III) transport system ATP-binding protein
VDQALRRQVGATLTTSDGAGGVRDQGSDAAPHLVVEGVSKRFGRFTALDDISVAIGRGEFVCLLGPSGCGKTTLLRAIAGLDRQSAGRILLDGRDISDAPPAARDYGIVFQSYALFPNLTVRDNIAYGLVNRGHGRAAVAERVDALLAMIGLPEQAAKYPGQLSGGQQQRVALARALAVSPSLLLLDEPLSALDAQVRQSLRGEIRGLQRRLKVTTVMVTHDQEEALAMADRVVVMNHGVIEQIGTPAEVYGRPRTPFVATFVGRMNFLDGERLGPTLLRLGAANLTIAASGDPPVGPVRVAFRPEDVVVGAVTKTTPNRLPGRVVGIEFLGSFHRCEIRLSDEASMTVDIAAGAARELGIETGDELWLALPPDRLHLYPR